ncbi:MAG TPA: SPOR domain-containing protein [Rhodocyclaceae bacterium]|nr:SPOR domain-containing protein [Rhodocyclaceae bacterium]
MIRSLVFLLVFGNIIVFALSAGWFGGGAAPSVPVVGHQPLSPERIRIVSRGEPPPLQPKLKQCLEWTALPGSQAAAIEKLAAGLKDLALLREETRAATRSHRVFIPVPKGGKSAGEKKAAELKTLGVKTYRLVEGGSNGAWAVVLGTYDSEDKARDALAAFKKTGVRSAQHDVQVEAPAQFRIRLSGPSEALLAARKLADPVTPAECPAERENGAADGAVPDSAPAAAAPAAGQS